MNLAPLFMKAQLGIVEKCSPRLVFLTSPLVLILRNFSALTQYYVLLFRVGLQPMHIFVSTC